MKKINKKEDTCKKENNIILFFLFMLGVFIIFDLVSNKLITLLGQSIILGKYGLNVIAETIFLVLIIILLLLFKNKSIFRKREVGFFRGLILGLPIIIILSLRINFESLSTASIFDTLSLLLYATLVGFAEEFLCRGLILDEMLKRNSDNRRQVIISIILSGLLFGLMHLTNFFSDQGIIETISQIIQATCVGFLFGAIYYRSKNIWLVVFLHALWDFCLMTGDLNLLKECTFLNPSFKATLSSLIGSLALSTIFVTAGIFQLRKSKICANFGEELTKEEKEKEIATCIVTIFAGFAIFYCLSFINTPFLKEYENSSVCYEYPERELNNYSLTRYHKDSYEIEYELWEEVMDDKVEEVELEWIEDYSFEVSLEDDKLTITNELTEESITLDYIVKDYVVVKSDDEFLIGILVEEKEGSILYYSSYITEENISNDKKYLNDIKSSFMRFVLPDSTGIVTLLENNSDKPLIAVQNKYGFTYIDDDEIYMVLI